MGQLAPYPLKTPFYDYHQALGAKIVPFAGWQMPLHYRGIIEEHHTVRQGAGLFDVSHMGCIRVTGDDAASFIEWLGTNAVVAKRDFLAIYTVLCRADGTAVDDVLVLRHSSNHCWLIANAANREKVLQYLYQQAEGWDVRIEAPRPADAILALQGPRALEIAAEVIVASQKLLPMHFCVEEDLLVACTGYTGERGIEIFGPATFLMPIWERLLACGAMPVGLGARDTLRLEMGYALYGHELGDSIAPTESVARWTMKWKKPAFIAQQALLNVEASPDKRYQYGLKVEEGIPRAGYPVWQSGREVGLVTSGSFSPSLKMGIAIVMTKGELSDEAAMVEIRGKHHLAFITELPFYSVPTASQ